MTDTPTPAKVILEMCMDNFDCHNDSRGFTGISRVKKPRMLEVLQCMKQFCAMKNCPISHATCIYYLP